MKKALMIAACLLFVIIFATTAWCGMIINANVPGVQSTAVPGAVTDNFDSLPQGNLTN